MVGFIDAETHSALGCGPDWPLCHGQLIPPLTNEHVIIEFTHRLLVGVGGLMAVLYLGLAWRHFKDIRDARRLSAVGIGFIVIQSIMGGMAVLFVNPPWVLALHLGFGLMAMGAAVLLAVLIGQIERAAAGQESGWTWRQRMLPEAARSWIWGTWVSLYAAIYLGSYVAFRNAGPACPTWPLCPVSWPPWASLADLDLFHRLVAVGLLAIAIQLWQVNARVVPDRPDLRAGAGGLLALVLVQIVSGAVLVWSRLALWAYITHVGLVMALFAVASYLVLQAWPAPPAARGRVQPAAKGFHGSV